MTNVHRIHGGGASIDARADAARQAETYQRSERARHWSAFEGLTLEQPVDTIARRRFNVAHRADRWERAEEMSRARRRRLVFVALVFIGFGCLFCALQYAAAVGML